MLSKHKMIIFLIAVLLGFAGEARSEDFRIGLILTLSGSWQEFGIAQQQAVGLAQQDRPDMLKTVKFIFEDDAYSGKNAVAAFMKLVERDRVNAVFIFGVDPSLAVAPIAEQYKVPLFVSALDPRIAIGRRFVIRTINPALDHATVMARYLVSQNYKKIGLVKTEGSFFEVMANSLLKCLPPDVEVNVAGNHLPNETDYKSTIIRLKNATPDAVGAYLDPKQVLTFFRQRRELHLTQPVFGPTTLQSRSTIADAAGAMDGAVFAHNFVDEEFRQRYIANFGNDYQIPWAANAYDFATLAGELLSRGETTGEGILQAASKIPERRGVGGLYHFVEQAAGDKFFRYPIGIYRIFGDDYHLLKVYPDL